MTKFKYGCSATGFTKDAKSVFYYIDVKGDGSIDMEELSTWRSVRDPHLAQLRKLYSN